MTFALLLLNRYANDRIENKMPLLTRWVRVTDWYSLFTFYWHHRSVVQNQIT
jgi:hypothetical protein